MKLVILDRDGTINQDRDDFVKSPEEWVALPGALEAIARLNHAGWHTVIATNQSGLARGLFDMAALNAIHARMNRELAALGGRIDAVFFCPHGPDDGCLCRKPLPGLCKMIAERYGVDLGGAHVVGDSLRDLQAGAAAGCATHLVRTGKGAALDPAGLAGLLREAPGARVHADLAAFSHALIHDDRRERGLVDDEADSLFGKLA
jgi:D-glycero-D-manno-heptose 1,7-bisphosphate phosphatase